MDTVIYTRISRDREGAGLGVDRQREDCEKLAEQLGWNVVRVYSDNDISAYSGKRRPEYQAMLTDLDAGLAQGLIAWHADRLHRSPVELESFIDLCERRSVEIRTVTAGDMNLSTASGKMVARMLGAAARHEVEHSVERQKRAKFQAAMAGKFKGGPRSFGYNADGVSTQEIEAASIRDGATKVLSGATLSQIKREWNAAGLTSTAGKPWTVTSVRRVLVRPRIAALMTYQGNVVGAAEWPAIITGDEHYALVAILTDPARRSAGSYERKYMGSGVYLCGRCGSKMNANTSEGKSSKNYRMIYQCRAEAHLVRTIAPVDNLISSLILHRLSQPDAALVLDAHDVDLPALQTQRDGLQARLDELAAMFVDGDIDGSQLKRGTSELRIKVEALDQKLAEGRASSPLADLVLAGDQLAEKWAGLRPDAQGRVITALMTVRIMPQPRGRQPNGTYFSPEYIRVEWRTDEGM